MDDVDVLRLIEAEERAAAAERRAAALNLQIRAMKIAADLSRPYEADK